MLLACTLPAADIDPGYLAGANGPGNLFVALFEDGKAIVSFAGVANLVPCLKVSGFPTCSLGNDANGDPILVVAGDVTFTENKPGSTTLSEILRFPEDNNSPLGGLHVTNLVQLLSDLHNEDEPPADANETVEYNDVGLTFIPRLQYPNSSMPGPFPEDAGGTITYIPTIGGLPSQNALYFIVSDAPEPESAGLFAVGAIAIASLLRWRYNQKAPPGSFLSR